MKFDCVFSVVYPSMDLITNYDSMCPGCITMCMEEGSEIRLFVLCRVLCHGPDHQIMTACVQVASLCAWEVDLKFDCLSSVAYSTMDLIIS